MISFPHRSGVFRAGQVLRTLSLTPRPALLFEETFDAVS